MPTGVRVIQSAAKGWSYGQLRRDADQVEALLDEIEAFGREFPVRHWGVAAPKFLHEAIRARFGKHLPLATLGGMGGRGSNKFRRVERWHVVSRVWPPRSGFLPQLQALFPARDISGAMKGSWRRYGGQCVEGYSLDYVHPLMSTQLWWKVEGEIRQAIGRARPTDVGSDTDSREALTIVIHNTVPISGLRIDELRGIQLDRERHHRVAAAEADRKVEENDRHWREQGLVPTYSQLAAGTSRRAVSRVLERRKC